jgi:O-antigen ligase
MLNTDTKLLTLPILALLTYIVFTYLPLIYTYLPFFGKIKIVLIAGIIMLIGYIFSRDKYMNTGVQRQPEVIAWAGFLGVMLFGLLLSLDRGRTQSILIANIKYFTVLFVMINVIDSSRRIDMILGVFSACAVGMAISSIINSITGAIPHEGYKRIVAIESGIFGDPNDLALLFNTTLPFLLYFLLKRQKKLIPFLGIITVITAIMLTYSRGGFLGLCSVGLGFYLFFARKNKKYLFLIAILAISFWFFSPDTYKERISTITDFEVDEETGMTGTRMDAWRIVVKEGLKHPILGAGAGSSYYLAGKEMSDWHQVHNSFIQILVEMGIPGFIFYMLLYLFPFKQYWNSLGKTPKISDIDISRYKLTLVAFLSYAVTVFFLPQAYSPILYMLTGIALIQRELIFKKQKLTNA